MSRQFKFSKGTLEVDDSRIVGTIKASTDMQQAPNNLAIDTAIDRVGPISINEFKQANRSIAISALLACGAIGGSIGLIIALFGDFFAFTTVITTWLIIGFCIGIVAAAIILKKVHFFVAQFLNDGQTVYVLIKKEDITVLEELDAYVRELKHK